MKSRLKLEKNRLIATIIVLIYFCFILFVYYTKIELQFIRVLGELLTIPALLALVSLPIWALVDNLRKKNQKQSTYIFTLLVSLFTIVMLLITNSYFS
ncbi:hypothetical protein [Lacinutrix algicola]|uniref:hypothetical protein n=1 Tax=Lacinutrix algicola TaxID=342954 RepID=UPI0006E46021|nr:hypothetical protein [Lacinutrix algicola]